MPNLLLCLLFCWSNLKVGDLYFFQGCFVYLELADFLERHWKPSRFLLLSGTVLLVTFWVEDTKPH